jgi:hypothetical protein
MFNMPCRYISSVEANEGATVAVVSSPEPEYVVGSNSPKELKDPSRERFDLLMQVVTPFASLPLTKENIKSVKTAFILKNSEQARHHRFPLPSTDEIRRAVSVVRVRHLTTWMLCNVTFVLRHAWLCRFVTCEMQSHF